MLEIGRLAYKIAGRDSDYCAIIKIVDDKTVTVDGNVRRKNVNIDHLHLLDKILPIKENAKREEIQKHFANLGITSKKFGDKRTRKAQTITRVEKLKQKKIVKK